MNQSELSRQLKVQQALFDIADAAGSVKSMDVFYKKLHKIVGRLMYAKSFYVILHDKERGIVGEDGYFVDAFGDTAPPPGPMSPYEKTPSMVVLKSGKTMHLPRKEMGALKESGVIDPIGSSAVDWLGVPLKDKKETFGVVVIQSYEEGVLYSDEDVKVLEFVAQHIATALTRIRALEAERQRTDELAILNSVGDAMAKSLDVKTVTKIVGDKVRDIFQAQATMIVLYDEKDNVLDPEYLHSTEDRYLEIGERIPFGTGLTSKVIHARKPILIASKEEMLASGAYTPKILKEKKTSLLEIESWLGVPILIKDMALGVVVIMDYAQKSFTESDQRLLETLASNMGVAIQNARLFEAEQERAAELAIINAVQRALAAELDTIGIFDAVGGKLREIFDYQDVSIYTADLAADTMTIEYTFEKGRKHERLTVPINSVYKYVVKEDKTLVFNGDFSEFVAQFEDYEVPGGELPRSLLVVPVPHKKDATKRSYLTLQDVEGKAVYSDSHVRLLETLASAMSVALQNAQSFKGEQERVAELQIINSIQQGLAAELDFQAIVDLVGDRLQDVFNTQDMAIRWYDEKANAVHFLYEYEHGERITVPVQHPPSPGGSFEQFLRDRKPLIGNTAEIMASTDGTTIPGTDTSKSLISVPIVSNDRLIGSLQMEDFERENAYGESDLRLLTTIAASLGTALENARLFGEVQKQNVEISENFEQQTATSNVLKVIADSPTDIRPVLDAVAENAARLCEADDVQVYQVDGDMLRQVTHFGPLPALQDGESLPLVPGLLTGRAVLEHRTIHTEDNQNLSKTEYPDSVKLQKRLKHRTTIVTPLITEDTAIGAIVVRRNIVRPFTDKQISLLSTFAAQSAIAIENVRLFTETQRLLKETEKRNAELAIINSVQQGLASKLEMQAIYELVGDKLSEITNSEIIVIHVWDEDAETIRYEYIREKGQRLYVEERSFSALDRYILPTLKRGETVIWNDRMAQRLKEFRYEIPVGEMPLSVVSVPIRTGSKINTSISLQSTQREFAFNDETVRLVETLANSMGVALESARLFDETQRLLKETEERNAELAIINSVQQGLATKLEIASIYEMVGEQLNQVFPQFDISLGAYDPETDLITAGYVIEHGKRLKLPPIKVGDKGFISKAFRTRKTIVVNENSEEEMKKVESYIIEGTSSPKSHVFTPLVVGDTVRGIVILQDMEHEGAFSDSNVRLLETIANSMSVALENARLFDETQRLLKETEDRNAELAIINSVQQGLASKMEMKAIYDLVGDNIRETFSADTTFVALYDEENGVITAPYYSDGGKQLGPISRQFGKGLAEFVIDSGKPLLLNTSQEMKPYGLYSIQSPGSEMDLNKSYLSVPLFSGGKVVGVVSVQSYKEYAYSENDTRLLTTLTNTLGVALENARLFDETQRLLKETEARAAELSTINAVSSALVAEPELESIIKIVGDQMRRIFEANVVYIALLDQETETISFPYEYGEEFPPMKLGEGLTSKIIQSGEPLLINHDLEERRKEMGATLVGEQVSSYLGVPIFGGGQAIGVISVQCLAKEGKFKEDDVRLLNTIAANVGAAIRNAQLLSETRKARKMAEEATRAKSAFLANMSHELRTPLNAIIGFTRIVRRKGNELLPAKQLDNLDKVLTSSDHLLGLINTVLDIAKIEAGRMDVQASNFEIKPTIELVGMTVQPLIRSTDVKLVSDVAENIPLLHTDQDKLKQILLNLLSNAAKFTHEGSITIQAKAANGNLVVDVNDTGIGISPEALEQVFEEFQQADSSTTREYGGTGLGLAISRSIARLLGGDLYATSQEGVGSTFTLVVPLYYGNQASEEAKSPEKTESRQKTPLRDPAILVIDDHPHAVALLREILEEAGYQVLTASDGVQGLQMAQEHAPLAITLDIMMPNKDGWQVLYALKNDHQTRDIPVILVTVVDQKALGYQLGATDYLIKPLNADDLLDSLSRIVSREQRSRLLVVDDDPNVHAMVSQLLEDSNYQIQAVSDGAQAVVAAKTDPPDVILLDLLMPHMDGFGVIEELRQHPETSGIPIVILTAKSLSTAEEKSLGERIYRVIQKQGLQGAALLETIASALTHAKTN